jgi:putative FmdB family regulatory protein
MPLYEYICKECGYHFEVLRPIKDADKPIACRRCASETTERQISVFFAQSGGRVVAGGNGGGCAGCSGGSCSTCGH